MNRLALERLTRQLIGPDTEHEYENELVNVATTRDPPADTLMDEVEAALGGDGQLSALTQPFVHQFCRGLGSLLSVVRSQDWMDG